MEHIPHVLLGLVYIIGGLIARADTVPGTAKT
jgi:hypothetical protein